jgi:hypothetical protein
MFVEVGDELKISSTKFVTQNAGKLRDYYRIGKMLGSGKDTNVIKLNRCFRRSEDVRAQRNRSPESSKGTEKEPYGRRWEENAL